MMDDQKDDFDDFDDEFFDDDFDDGVAGDVSEDLGSPDSFGDDWDFDEQQKPAKSKKSGKKSSNAIIIVLALVVGLGVLAYQVMGDKIFGGNKFASSMTEEMSSEESTDISDNVTDNVQVEEEPVDIGSLYGDDNVGVAEIAKQNPSNFEDELPMPVTVTQEEESDEVDGFMSDFEFTDYSGTSQTQEAEMLTAEEQQPAEDVNKNSDESADESAEIDSAGLNPEFTDPNAIFNNDPQTVGFEEAAENELTALASGTTDMPAEGNEPMQTDAVTDDAVVEVAELGPAPQAEEQAQSAEMSSEIMEKLDMVLARLDKVESTVSAMETTTAPSTSNEDVDQLKQTIASLEKDIAALKKNPVQAKTTTTKSSAPKKTVKKKVAPRKVSWELRAAQPGKAWVAKKGQKDIKSVSVGDRLDGVGTIRSISFVDGKWVVTGSSATIRQ